MAIRTFSRHPRAQAQPGRCVRCPRNEDLVDLGAPEIPNFGVVYVCTVCLGELMKAMGVIDADTYSAAVQAGANRAAALETQLADAEQRAAAPLAFVTTQLEEFSDGIAVLARGLVRSLAAGPAGDDRVPSGPVEPVAAAEPVVLVEPAAAGERVDEEPGDIDAGAALLAAFGIAAAPDGAPAGADAGSDGGADAVGEPVDGLDVLYDQGPR